MKKKSSGEVIIYIFFLISFFVYSGYIFAATPSDSQKATPANKEGPSYYKTVSKSGIITSKDTPTLKAKTPSQPAAKKSVAPVLDTPAATKPAQNDDLVRFINSLKKTTDMWPMVSSRSSKEMAVYYFIDELKAVGIVIKKPAGYYAAIIDEMVQQSPEFLSRPFDQVLQTVAIVEYDLDNGQDKDMLAKKVLGEDGYLRNKERLKIK